MDSSLPPDLEYRGWNIDDYRRALHDFMCYPPQMPEDSEEQIQYHTGKLLSALEKIGILNDGQTLLDNGVYSRQQLATLEKKDLEILGVKGTLEQYKSIYEPAMEECPSGGESSECELYGTFTHEYLVQRLILAVENPHNPKIWRYMQNEIDDEELVGKKHKREVLEQGNEA